MAKFRKLSPKELRARGFSPTSEKYVSRNGRIISKRQYQQRQLKEVRGQRITLEQRAINYAKGLWAYVKGAIRAARGRKAQAARVKEKRAWIGREEQTAERRAQKRVDEFFPIGRRDPRKYLTAIEKPAKFSLDDWSKTMIVEREMIQARREGRMMDEDIYSDMVDLFGEYGVNVMREILGSPDLKGARSQR